MDIDFHSTVWIQVVAWATSRMNALRLKNDGELDPLQTATVRGELKALKTLLGLPSEVARARESESAQAHSVDLGH